MQATNHSRHGLARGGFSLIELVVVVAVMALLAGVLTPVVGRVIEDSKVSRAKSDARAIVHAIGRYRLDVGAYPGGPQANATYNYGYGGAATGAEYHNAALVQGAKKYLQEAIGTDPWGRNYAYHIYTQSNPYQDVVVYSYGPNGVNETWDGNAWNQGKFNGDDIGAFWDQ
jgi:general secretion pathway protein G